MERGSASRCIVQIKTALSAIGFRANLEEGCLGERFYALLALSVSQASRAAPAGDRKH